VDAAATQRRPLADLEPPGDLTTMATYGARPGELRALLSPAAAGADERVRTALTQCVDRYVDLRQRALDDLVDIVTKASAGNLGTTARWDDRVVVIRTDYNRLFGDSVEELMLPPPLQLFWSTALQAEESFFEPLTALETPQFLDEILKHQDGLSKLIGELRDAWKFVLTADTALETDQLQAVRQIDQMVQEIIEDLDKWHKQLVDNAAKAAEAAKKKVEELKAQIKQQLGPAGEWLETAIEALKQWVLEQIKPDGMPGDMEIQLQATQQQLELAAAELVERTRLHRALVQTYRTLVSTERGGVLTMFNKTRDDVERYMKENNITKAHEWIQEARREFPDWISALPTASLRDDATAFQAEILRRVEENWKVTEELDKKFREEFVGVFASPLSNETIETLAERHLFEKQLEAITGRDADRKLLEHLDRVRAFRETFEAGLAPLDDIPPVMPEELRDLVSLRNKEFRAFVHDRIEHHMRALLHVIPDLYRIIEPSTLEEELGRRELEEMLE
jgi:hypothetical protein